MTCSLKESGTPKGLADVLDAQLYRWNRRLLSAPSKDLVERDSGLDVATLRLLRMRLREEYGARSHVIAADFAGRERVGRINVLPSAATLPGRG